MLNVTRRHIIYDYIKSKGNVTVSELQKKLDVSDMTIRRDLSAMESEGLLKRVHGGATVAEILSTNESTFLNRTVLNQELKIKIARCALDLIQKDDTVFIDASSTCSELANLIQPDMNITVFTNSFDVINKLRKKAGVNVISLGGQLAADDNTFDGLIAVETAERIRVNKCFFSGASFQINGVYNAGIVGTAIKKMMIKNARTKFLIADSTKYNGPGVMELCKWQDIDVFITDSNFALKDRYLLREQGVKIQIVEVSISDDLKRR